MALLKCWVENGADGWRMRKDKRGKRGRKHPEIGAVLSPCAQLLPGDGFLGGQTDCPQAELRRQAAGATILGRGSRGEVWTARRVGRTAGRCLLRGC